MHARQVIAFEIVIHVGLPIAVHLVDAALEPLHSFKLKLPGLLWQIAQTFTQRVSIGVKVHKDEVEPLLHPHRHQRKLFGTKSFDSLNLCGADERSIQAISPAVIPAAEEPARSASLGGRTGAVTANVIKAAQSAVRTAHDEQRLTHQLRREVVARICRLVAMSHRLPALPKDSFSLGL